MPPKSKFSILDEPPKYKKVLVKTARLPKVDAPILHKKRVTPKGMPKYIDTLMAAFAPHLIPETLQALRIAISENNIRGVEMVLKAYGITQAGTGLTINNNNANINGAEAGAGHRSLDSFLRDRAVTRMNVIDMKPEVKALDCPPLSLPNKPSSPPVATEWKPVVAGSATLA